MYEYDFKKIAATKADKRRRSLIEIPIQNIGCHYSSLTDHLDNIVGYNPKMMKEIDGIVQKFHLGAVTKRVDGHQGTVLPRITRHGKVLGGCVSYFDVCNGNVIYSDKLIDHLYPWYGFDYYEDMEVFFGEHTLSGKPVAVVSEEKTAVLGTLAGYSIDWLAVGWECNLTTRMMDKLYGRKVVLFPDSMSYDNWKERFGSKFTVSNLFDKTDINNYLVDVIKGRSDP